MKSLQKRLSQLYEQQSIEEKKVIQSIQKALDNIAPFSSIKSSITEILSSEELDSYYSKKSFTLLLNKTIDSIIPKPEIINQTIKALVQTRFVDILFDKHKVNVREKESEFNNQVEL
jgi:hypothetical protein